MPPPVSIIIKKEESPIIVPLLESGDEGTKSEEHSPLPSLCYPSSSSSSRASSRLSLYHTRSSTHCFSPYRRGNSSDSTYHPASTVSYIRSPTPLEQPVDWNPVYNHRVMTDTTIVFASTRVKHNRNSTKPEEKDKCDNSVKKRVSCNSTLLNIPMLPNLKALVFSHAVLDLES